MAAQTMDDLKFIGFPGIFTHSFRTINTWKKIFAQITLTLILPLTLTFIAHMHISARFFNQIEKNPYMLLTGAFESYRSYYYSFYTTGASSVSSATWRYYFIFKSISIVTVTVLSVISTASVVYTIASIYTDRHVTFRKSMKSVPHVWKRVTVTLLCMFVTLFVYCLLVSVIIFILNASFGSYVINNLILLAIIMLSTFGFVYLLTVWQIASVVSVLEASSGIKSMIKSTDLLYGKRKSTFMISFMMYLTLAAIVTAYMSSVVRNDDGFTMLRRVMNGILFGVLMTIVFLFIMVTQTVVYLVCKLHHGESVDPVSLSTFLGAYLSDSRPVFRTGEDIQLGRPQNQPVLQV